MPTPRRPLPPVDELKAKYAELHSTQEVAAVYGVDPRRVAAVLRDAGVLKEHPRPDLPTGDDLIQEFRDIGTLRGMADKYQTSYHRLRRTLREAGVSEDELRGQRGAGQAHPLEEHLDEILSAHRSGISDEEIGRRYGATRYQVRWIRHKHGTTARKHKRLSDGEREKIRLLVAQPDANLSAIARQFDVSPATIRRYRPRES